MRELMQMFRITLLIAASSETVTVSLRNLTVFIIFSEHKILRNITLRMIVKQFILADEFILVLHYSIFRLESRRE